MRLSIAFYHWKRSLKQLAQIMDKSNENNKPEPTSSKNRKETDLKKSKWYSPIRSKAKSSNRKNKSKSSSKQEKIDEYFTPESPKVKQSDSTRKVFKKRKYLSPSVKLESKIPKVEDILRDMEESKKLQEIDKLIKKSSTQFLKGLKKNDLKLTEKPKVDIIDCKHLSLNQLERRFRGDIKYIDGVFNGTVYSKRHELFQKQLSQGTTTLVEDLRVSESLAVFTSDQLVHLVSLFRNRYDNGNKYKYSDYYFKVLLPEYCLKLFMDCHKKSLEEALEYLKNVPIPDLFGLM